MGRDQLKRWIEQGLSLEQIGALVDRDPSTVGYWVKKHGLTPNGQSRHAARGGLNRAELEALLERGCTVAEIAETVGRSSTTVRHWMKAYGLRAAGRRGRRPFVPRADVDAAIRAGRRTLLASCPHHGEGVFVIENSGRARCRRCRMQRVADRRRTMREILVAEAGGECKLCGYRRCIAALEFHHLDPKTKRFGLSMRGITRSLAELRREAKKCVLLCSNCHAEVEAGFSSLE